MARDGNIRSFFSPVPKVPEDPPASQNAQSQASPQLSSQSPASLPPSSKSRASPPPSSQPSLPAAPSSLHLPSSPLPEQDEKKPRCIDAVIKGSDDEDDDSLSSEADLPNLFAKPKSVPVPSNKGFNPCVTPKAKRTARDFHSSPLTIMPKHKFDMKALLSHAKSHDAAEVSAQRMSNIISEGATAAPTTTRTTTTLYETMMDVLSDADDEDDEAERNKLLRAVKRTEASMDRKRWCFFEQTHDGNSISAPNPFPEDAAKGGWKCLADPKTRNHVFGDGLSYAIQLKKRNLPDEIFLWVLDEIRVEKSESFRDEYSRLLGVCPGQVQHFVDGDLLDRLFLGLGACNEALDQTAKIVGAVEPKCPYSERSWSMLQSILTLLSRTSNAMAVPALIHATSILLRLGIDTLVIENIAVRKDFSDAVENLVLAVPIKSWDRFCEEVCLSFHEAVSEASLWLYALAVLPAGNSRVVELRRRLALVCFFDEPWRASQHPDDNVNIPAIIDRLEDGKFVVGRETDYYELAAYASILTIAIGDGCGPAPSDDPGMVRQFDDDVDMLCKRVKRIWSVIDTGGAAYISRLEARTAWQNLQHQLPHVVRTRPPPKTGILDLPNDKEDPFLPKQRNFMAKFFRKESPIAQPG